MIWHGFGSHFGSHIGATMASNIDPKTCRFLDRCLDGPERQTGATGKSGPLVLVSRGIVGKGLIIPGVGGSEGLRGSGLTGRGDAGNVGKEVPLNHLSPKRAGEISPHESH
mgnify:CR=1 FL=1